MNAKSLSMYILIIAFTTSLIALEFPEHEEKQLLSQLKQEEEYLARLKQNLDEQKSNIAALKQSGFLTAAQLEEIDKRFDSVNREYEKRQSNAQDMKRLLKADPYERLLLVFELDSSYKNKIEELYKLSKSNGDNEKIDEFIIANFPNDKQKTLRKTYIKIHDKLDAFIVESGLEYTYKQKLSELENKINENELNYEEINKFISDNFPTDKQVYIRIKYILPQELIEKIYLERLS